MPKHSGPSPSRHRGDQPYVVPALKEKRKRHSGPRSEEAVARRRGKLRNKILQKMDNDHYHVLKKYPDEFLKVGTGAPALQERILQRLPEAATMPLKVAPATGTFVVDLDDELLKGWEEKDHSRGVLVRGDIRTRFDASAKGEVLWALWLKMIELGLDPQALGLKNQNRSSETEAVHIGQWHIFTPQPIFTADTMKIYNNLTLRPYFVKFLKIIRDDIAPEVAQLTKCWCPGTWATQQKAYRYTKAILQRRNPELWELMDWKGAFFTIAIKEGVSEVLHLDWNDHPLAFTWVTAFGDYTGGHFRAPQLGFDVPLPPGHILGALTRRLLHCGTAAEGQRLVFTFFTNHTLVNHAERYHVYKVAKVARDAAKAAKAAFNI
ncbi:hypothetical protein DFP72DRAFT_1110493 [Ephemerocybe angulata]|uniref:Uncharacterized protein n=1 Tax=Ephemerocybe angulata TaxID=980116 RepID=A0A8H6I5I5_9AGAR|nr:hypothetical protein DFP72DRAFT_1110493 [Tulosesus angulatus]